CYPARHRARVCRVVLGRARHLALRDQAHERGRPLGRDRQGDDRPRGHEYRSSGHEQSPRARRALATMLGKQLGPQYVIRVSRDRKSLKVMGGMNDGATDTLTRALNSVPSVGTVTFNSGGGWVREGHLKAAVISQRGLATHVDGECSSACTLAFLAGKQRTLGPNGRIGFHRVRSIGGTELQQALDITRTQSIYQSAGLPSDFIDKVMATPPDQIWYPTPTELRAANVITAGREWDEARADLTRQLRDSLGTTLKGVRLSDEGLDALLDCEVSDFIKWLNTTDCPYLYDKATTS